MRIALLLLALTTTSSLADSKPWWTTKVEKRSGKTSGSARFTVQLPSAIEQSPAPTSHMFSVGAGTELVSLTVRTMPEFAQHTKTYDEFKREYIREKAEIYQEESSKQGFAVLFKEEPKANVVIGTVVNAVGDTQSMCTWEIPIAQLKNKTVPGWDVMKKACRTITLSYK